MYASARNLVNTTESFLAQPRRVRKAARSVLFGQPRHRPAPRSADNKFNIINDLCHTKRCATRTFASLLRFADLKQKRTFPGGGR
jgi:hypothetical protein